MPDDHAGRGAERPIARGLAGPGLLAHVLVSKYCDHLPLYRQSEIYAREGVELERSTLADWVGQCSALLRAAGRRARALRAGGPKLHADDTPVPVLQPGRGTTKQGGCGPTCVTTVRQRAPIRRRCGSRTPRIARACIRART